jgi:hypothetical protein
MTCFGLFKKVRGRYTSCEPEKEKKGREREKENDVKNSSNERIESNNGPRILADKSSPTETLTLRSSSRQLKNKESQSRKEGTEENKKGERN